MNRRKIFIGIDLPGDVKKRLGRKIEPWQDLPVKWIREDNFHVTLVFLGYVDDEKIFDICSASKRAAANCQSFELSLDLIELAPTPDRPRMIWAIGDQDEELRILHENLEKELDIFVSEKKAYRPHVTLGRIRARRWNDLSEKPAINESLKVLIPIDQIIVFESRMENGKQMYTPLEICELQYR